MFTERSQTHTRMCMCATLARLVPSFRTDSYSFRRHRSTVLNDHANKVSPSDDNDEVTTPDVHES